MGIPLNPNQSVQNLISDMGGAFEQSYINVSGSSTGAFETFTIVCPATAAVTQGDYFTFVEPVSGDVFAVWLDVDADGTEPNGAIYAAADQKIEVNIATGNTAAQVAAAVKAAIELDADFTEYGIGIGTATLTFTANLLGNAANAATSNEAEDAAGSFVAATTQAGAAAASQNTYVVLRDDDTGLFHAWFNINDEGVDPEPDGSTGIEVALSTGATNAQVATALAAAIEAHAEFTSSADGTRVKVVTATKAPVTDLGAGDSGFTVEVRQQGNSSKYSSGGSPSDISNNPSTF